MDDRLEHTDPVSLVDVMTREHAQAIWKRFDDLTSWLYEHGIACEHDEEMLYWICNLENENDTPWFVATEIPPSIDPLIAGIINAHAEYYLSHYRVASEKF
jgi:hypothetical protein